MSRYRPTTTKNRTPLNSEEYQLDHMSSLMDSPQGDRLNILMIEDNPGDAKLVEIYLNDAPNMNLKLKHVSYLKDGLALSDNGEYFDVVLLDLKLPDSVGPQTLQTSLEHFPSSTSIVVLTGDDNQENGIKAIKMGAQDYLVKGQIDMVTLQRSMLHAIHRRGIYLDRENALKKAKESEKRLVQAQEIARVGNYELVLGGDDTMLWSEQLYRILEIEKPAGHRPNLTEFLGKINEDEIKDAKQKWNDVLYLKGVGQNYELDYEINSSMHHGIKYVRAQGQIERCGETGRRKVVGTLQDVTDSKLAEKMVRQARERYKIIFDQSLDPMFIFGKDGRFSMFNQALVNMLKSSKEDIRSFTLLDLIASEEDKRVIASSLELNQIVNNKELELLCRDGTRITCVMSLSPWRGVNDGARIGEYNGVIRDITAYRQKEELMREIEVAEQSAHLKEQFLLRMSHEIRTPMNVVIGMAQLLESTPLNIQQSNYVETLKLSSESLLRLINQILDFSKIGSGELQLEKVPFDLHDMINDLIGQHNYHAQEKGIELIKAVSSNLPRVVISDPVYLHNILSNLLNNAIKYTHEGEVQLLTKVAVIDADHVNVTFSVRDTGIGIPDSKLKDIFNSFTQAAQSDTRLYGGTGLGLSIVKELVELFGGKIEVKSEQSRGSTFTFNIPFLLDNVGNVETVTLRQLDRKANKAKELNKGMDHASTYSRDNLEEEDKEKLVEPINLSDDDEVRILLVEDNKLNQKVAAGLLNQWQYQVDLSIANHGGEAIEILEKEVFDIILMDISMPVMDGYETTKHIRNVMPHPINKIPIIAMTAHAFTKNADQCYEVGMNAFVSKPINGEVFFFELANMMSESLKLGIRSREKLTASKADTGGDSVAAAANSFHSSIQEKETSVSENTSEPLTESKMGLQIDLSQLESLSGGDKGLVLSFVETIVEELPQELAQLWSDLQAKDWDKLKKSAHKLKSTTGYMGLAELQELARKIENSAWERKDLNQIPNWVKDLVSGCEVGHKQIKAKRDELKAQLI